MAAEGTDVMAEGAKQTAALTPEEADQLARAVVIVAGIHRVPQRTAARAEPPAEPQGESRTVPPVDLVLLSTADPNVTIYWQIESNGG